MLSSVLLYFALKSYRCNWLWNRTWG